MYAGGGGRGGFLFGTIYIAGRRRRIAEKDRSLEYIDTPLCRVHKIAFTFY